MALSDLIGDIGSGFLNLFGVESTNQRNERLMREQWQREDTAMQRRVQDLEAAGLSKWLAAGTGGASASSPVTLQTPDFNFIGDAITHSVANDSTRAATKKAKEETDIIIKTASSQAAAAAAAAREAEANALMAEHDANVLAKRPYQMRGDSSIVKTGSVIGDIVKDITESSTAENAITDFKKNIIDMQQKAKEEQERRAAERERKRKEKDKAKQDSYWAQIHAAGDKAARDANVKWHWHRIWDNTY